MSNSESRLPSSLRCSAHATRRARRGAAAKRARRGGAEKDARGEAGRKAGSRRGTAEEKAGSGRGEGKSGMVGVGRVAVVGL